VIGRRLSESSVPLFEKTPPFFASLEKPLDGAVGNTRITSDVFERYHVALISAFSPQNPTSTPPSSSLVRSGCRVVAGLVKFVNSPPKPLCVGVNPVPCAIPPTRFVPLYVADVRYGCGSGPASPYEARTLPNVRKLGLYAFVNVHAAPLWGTGSGVFHERRRSDHRVAPRGRAIRIERRLSEVGLVVDLRLIALGGSRVSVFKMLNGASRSGCDPRPRIR
jgi:hypothetical protein